MKRRNPLRVRAACLGQRCKRSPPQMFHRMPGSFAFTFQCSSEKVCVLKFFPPTPFHLCGHCQLDIYQHHSRGASKVVRGNSVDRDFITSMRDGLNSLLNGVDHQCLDRGDALSELQEQVGCGGRQHETLQQLTVKKRSLREENEILRQEARRSPH